MKGSQHRRTILYYYNFNVYGGYRVPAIRYVTFNCRNNWNPWKTWQFFLTLSQVTHMRTILFSICLFTFQASMEKKIFFSMKPNRMMENFKFSSLESGAFSAPQPLYEFVWWMLSIVRLAVQWLKMMRYGRHSRRESNDWWISVQEEFGGVPTTKWWCSAPSLHITFLMGLDYNTPFCMIGFEEL